jgi:hypothetical protein
MLSLKKCEKIAKVCKELIIKSLVWLNMSKLTYKDIQQKGLHRRASTIRNIRKGVFMKFFSVWEIIRENINILATHSLGYEFR